MTRYLQVAGSYVVGPAGGGFAIPAPTVALSLVSGDLYEGNVATFRATLSKPWIVDVDVTYATSNGTASAGTDYTAASGTTTIAAGDRFVEIPVTTTLRSGVQSSRTFTLTISAAVDADEEALTITADDVTVTILDTGVSPDAPTLSVAAVAPANEGDPLTFRVTASYPFEEDITFTYVTSNGTATSGVDYTSASGTGTITAETLTDDIVVTTSLRSGYQGPRAFTLTISAAETASSVAVTITQPTATGTIAETEALTGANGYFETLIARPDHTLSESLRDQSRLTALRKGNATPNDEVAYNPGADTDPHAQDAAKATIKAFSYTGRTLIEAIDSTQTTLRAADSNAFQNDGALQVGSEIMRIVRPGGYNPENNNNVITIERGYNGTTPAAHAAGTPVGMYSNSLSISSQIVIPLGTADGNSYLFTWDMYYTDSYLRRPEEPETYWLKNYKAFQFTARNKNGTIWQEPATRFKSSGNPPSPAAGFDNTIHVAEADWRSYQTTLNPGGDGTYNPADPLINHPSVTNHYPLRPQKNTFIIHPNRWVRWWMHIVQNADDFDVMNVWIADEVQAPVHLFEDAYNNVYRPGVPHSIGHFWIELNTSDFNLFRTDLRDFVSYHRNFVMLTNPPSDWSALRVQPEAS